MTMQPSLGPALDDDARTAYLFRSGDSFAVSLDKAGANLPPPVDGGAWQFQQQFELGVKEAMPAPIDPEPILRGIKSRGYFVWHLGGASGTHATTQ